MQILFLFSSSSMRDKKLKKLSTRIFEEVDLKYYNKYSDIEKDEIKKFSNTVSQNIIK